VTALFSKEWSFYLFNIVSFQTQTFEETFIFTVFQRNLRGQSISQGDNKFVRG